MKIHSGAVRKEFEGHLSILTFPIDLQSQVWKDSQKAGEDSGELKAGEDSGELGEIRERFGAPRGKRREAKRER